MGNMALGSRRKDLFICFEVHLVKATQAPDGVGDCFWGRTVTAGFDVEGETFEPRASPELALCVNWGETVSDISKSDMFKRIVYFV
ncbi:hypothetical protein EYC80_000407 [Monilinia laxa]|uniref:Uncharacterized protein n=1 Tax=Monilinia laxa TaxID=61186 RepID=A0A5N6KAM7_MONLA|nr:hypothetical protein EYC80_000407 [Monilinia laxa]